MHSQGQTANPVSVSTTFPLLGGETTGRLDSFRLGFLLSISDLSRLVSSPGKQAAPALAPPPGTSSSTAAGKLQLHWPAAQPLGFGAHTKRNPPQLSALDKPLSPIPRPQERGTHSQPNGRSPLSRSEHLLSRGRLVTSCCWFPFPFTNRRFLNRIDSCPSLPREKKTTERASWLAGRGIGTRMPMGPQTQRPSTPKSTALVRHMRHGCPPGRKKQLKVRKSELT